MAFEAVQNLAVQQAAEDERRRRQELAQLADQAAQQKVDAADSPAALYQKATKAHQGISPELAADASDYRQLEANQRTRLERRAAPLQVPGPSAPERMQQMLGEVQQLGEPMPGEERSTRLSRLESARERTLGDVTGQNVPRETSPMFYSGSHPAGPAEDTGTLPYRGALDGLRGAEVPQAGIRPEFGGTAKDELLSFTNYNPNPGMKRYTSPGGGEQKDLGAPGGSFGSISGGGGQGGKAGDAVRSDLDRLIAETKATPLNPREEAGALVAAEPVWDETAASLGDPAAIGQQINQAVADGSLDHKVGAHLQHKYERLAHAATDEDGFLDPQQFRQLLGTQRPPAAGEAEHQAATGGQVIPQAEAEKVAMLHSVQQGVQDAPGTTLPPPESPGASPVPTTQPTPAQAPQMTATRRPPMQGTSDEELQALLDGIFPGAGRGMNPDAAAQARQRDALLASLRR